MEIFKLNHDETGPFWFTTVPNIVKGSLVELTIEVENEKQLTCQQLEPVSEFIGSIEFVKELVLQHLEKSFRGSRQEKSKTELATMYYLTAITFKRNQDQWVVFEPISNVETIFNFFPRFTIKDYKIKWSSI